MKNKRKADIRRGELINKCSVCQGYGMWAIGLFTSMGPIDAGEGIPTLPCPSCGADANPIKEKNEK